MISRITAKLGAVPRRVAQRFGWGLADQAMCSLSNAALSFYVARELGATQFGAFSLAYVTYSFALTSSRGLATDPLLVRFSGTGVNSWRRAVAQCTGTALVTGLVTGACALVAAMLLGGAPGRAFLALGLILPGLLLQDSWRYSFFALGQGSKAFVNDTVWTLMLVAPLLLLRVTHTKSVFWFLIAWGGAAAVAACIGPLQARVIPRPSFGWGWVSRHRDLGLRYMMENSANSGAGQLRIYGLGVIAGLAAVGYVQAAGLLLGPFLVIFLGISLVTVPEATRVLRHSPRHLRLYCLLVGVGLAILALAWGGALLVALPRGLGELLLGRQLWRPAQPAGGAVHAVRHGRLPDRRCHRRPARARRGQAQPARHDHRVGHLPRPEPDRGRPRRRRRDGPRRRPGDLGGGGGVVVAAGRGDAGVRQDP